MGNTSVTTKILRFLGTEKGLLTMSAIVALYAFVYQITIGEYIVYDTKSYFQAYESLRSGIIDDFRTPIYPIFVGIFQNILKGTPLYATIMLLQIIVFLISVHYLYILTKPLRDTKTRYLLTFVYGVIPLIPSWCNIILTESLAISGSIFYLYYTINSIKYQLTKYVWLSILWTLLLIMLRPAFIYLIPLNFFICIILFKKSTKHVIYNGFIGNVIIALIFCGYCYQMKQTYGIFSPSGVSIINKYVIDRENIFNTSLIKDKHVKTFIDSLQQENKYTPFQEAIEIANKLGYERLNNAISDNRQHMLIDHGIIKRIYATSRCNYSVVAGIIPLNFIEPVIPNLASIFIIIIIFSYIILAYIYTHKSIPYTTITLLFFSIGNILISIIGGPNDHGRLIMPSFPAVLLLTGILIQMIKVKSFLKNEFEE